MPRRATAKLGPTTVISASHARHPWMSDALQSQPSDCCSHASRPPTCSLLLLHRAPSIQHADLYGGGGSTSGTPSVSHSDSDSLVGAKPRSRRPELVVDGRTLGEFQLWGCFDLLACMRQAVAAPPGARDGRPLPG